MITKNIDGKLNSIILFWGKFSSSKEMPVFEQFVRHAMNDIDKSVEYFDNLFSKFNIDLDLRTREEYSELKTNFLKINEHYIHETQILNATNIAELNDSFQVVAGFILNNINVKENPQVHKMNPPPLFEIYLNVSDSNNGIILNMDTVNLPSDNDINHTLLPLGLVIGSNSRTQTLATADEKLLTKIRTLATDIDTFASTNRCFNSMKEFIVKVDEYYSEYGIISSPHLQLLNMVYSAIENYKN